MIDTTTRISRKLDIVDEACRILKEGGTKYSSGFGEYFYTPYICHALASAVEGKKGDCSERDFGSYAIVKEFTMFSAEFFGMTPLDDYSGMDWEKTKDEFIPYWWNSGGRFLEERINFLNLFKQHLTKELK